MGDGTKTGLVELREEGSGQGVIGTVPCFVLNL